MVVKGGMMAGLVWMPPRGALRVGWMPCRMGVGGVRGGSSKGIGVGDSIPCW